MNTDHEIETRRFAVAFLTMCLLFAVVGTLVSMIAH